MIVVRMPIVVMTKLDHIPASVNLASPEMGTHVKVELFYAVYLINYIGIILLLV